MIHRLKSFFAMEAAGGVVLMAVAVLAMLAANSPLAPHYDALFSPPVRFFINDGLMALFFLLVGLEIRAELQPGGLLSTRAQAALPLAAALGGVIVPALIYISLNQGEALRGWAIASATDIAFSLGVLALFGARLPPSLTIFLMAVAVIDDLAAVIIIALFYTDTLLTPSLIPLAACALGMLISPAAGKRLIPRLHPWVAFAIVPLFAFANAGISLSGIDAQALLQPVTLGIALGLFIGKPLGIFGGAWLLVRSGYGAFPIGARRAQFFAVCVTAGIGFTMSLFIGELAFSDTHHMKLGVLLGSLAAALCGGLLLWCTGRK